MGRFKKILCAGIACAAVALAGCSSTVGLTLDQSVRIGIEGESGYAKLDFPASWQFQGVEDDQTVDKASEGATYRAALVSPDDVNADPTAQVAASSTTSTLPINPDSSDERIYQYFDDSLSQTFENADVKGKSITHDGDATIVEYEFRYPNDSGTITSETKYILIGDYIYSISASTTDKADATSLATVKAIVADFGYVTNSE